MVRLVEEHAAIAPGALFIAPIRVFGGNHRVHVSSDSRIAEHLHRVPGFL
jgi:hypothetical protein